MLKGFDNFDGIPTLKYTYGKTINYAINSVIKFAPYA